MPSEHIVPFGDVPEMLAVITLTAALRPTHYIRIDSRACEIERSADGRPVDHYRVGQIDMSRKMGELVRVVEVLPKAHWIMHGKREVPGLSGRDRRPEKFSFGAVLPCQAVFVTDGNEVYAKNTSGQCSKIYWDSEHRRWCFAGYPFEMGRDHIVTVVAYAKPSIAEEENLGLKKRRR